MNEKDFGLIEKDFGTIDGWEDSPHPVPVDEGHIEHDYGI